MDREEQNLLMSYLDKDGDGQVDWEEFSEKVTFLDYNERCHQYRVSQKTFIDRMLNEWYTSKGAEVASVKQKLLAYDENGDGVF